MGDTVWGGGFGAEFFVFEREAYLHTSSEENGKNKQKYNKLEENRRFSTSNKNVFVHVSCLSQNGNNKIILLLVVMPKDAVHTHKSQFSG